MIAIEKKFMVELTEDEIRLIETSLHAAYKKMHENEIGRNMEKERKIRGLRNAFASLVGVTYTGVDA